MGSFLGKIQEANPVNQWLAKNGPSWLRYADPSIGASHDYQVAHSSTFAPGAYSGVTPTLADANRGYLPKPAAGVAPAATPLTGIAQPKQPLGQMFGQQPKQAGVWGASGY